MRKSRVAGLLFLATAALAQHQQSVEITSEPSHHLVFQNEYVRVFDVTVAPRATTLVHKHNYDYLFVTLGDSDVVSVRPGEKPVALKLKDGEVRFTPGNFAHAAINQSDRPFHNITIELLKPSSNVKQFKLAEGESVVTHAETAALSDQWRAWIHFLQPGGRIPTRGPALFVAVSDVDLKAQDGTKAGRRTTGDVMWIAPGASYTVGNGSQPGKFFLLEFKPEPSKP
jgi:quercetin dioxygenase-like cupin family protein